MCVQTVCKTRKMSKIPTAIQTESDSSCPNGLRLSFEWKCSVWLSIRETKSHSNIRCIREKSTQRTWSNNELRSVIIQTLSHILKGIDNLLIPFIYWIKQILWFYRFIFRLFLFFLSLSLSLPFCQLFLLLCLCLLRSFTHKKKQNRKNTNK